MQEKSISRQIEVPSNTLNLEEETLIDPDDPAVQARRRKNLSKNYKPIVIEDLIDPNTYERSTEASTSTTTTTTTTTTTPTQGTTTTKELSTIEKLNAIYVSTWGQQALDDLIAEPLTDCLLYTSDAADE